MTKVAYLDEYRPTQQGPVVCLTCGDNWWAVRTKEQQATVCPHCGTLTGFSLDAMLATVEKQFGEVFIDRLRTAIEVEYCR